MTYTGNERRDILLDEERLARIVQAVATPIASAVMVAFATGPVKERADDHEGRLRELEKWQWKQIGINVVLSTFVTVFVGISTWFVTSGLAQVAERIERIPASATGGKR